MPACSVCGQSVEYLRSCYSSKWHLFRDSLGTVTAGRYYFTPDSVPTYSGTHNYGSKTWNDANWQAQQALGEDIATKSTWNLGDPPDPVPNAVTSGTADCVQNGELITDAIWIGDADAGFPAKCWIPQVKLDPGWGEASAWYSCGLQLFYAQVVVWLYAHNIAKITQAFTMLLGGFAVTRVHLGTDLLPDVVTVIHPDFSIAVVDGTVNFQQAATQAFQGVNGPLNFGIYSTLPLWYDASTWVKGFLDDDGANHTKPIMLVGHSYGAAAVRNLAARYRNANATREIRLMTFGDPKPGDDRLRRITTSTAGIALATETDLVTILCPDNLTILPIAAALSILTYLVWDQWKRPPNQTLMDANGQLFPNVSVVADFDTLFAATQHALANTPLDFIAGHPISEYRSRIFFRCPFAEWPLTRALFAFIAAG